jgi:hypothetical protein
VIPGTRSVCYVCSPPNKTADPLFYARLDADAKARSAGKAEARASTKLDACKCGQRVYVGDECRGCYKRTRKYGNDGGYVTSTLIASVDSMLGLDRFLSTSTVIRCGCCRDTTDLVTDLNGNPWCSRCAYFIAACGRCPAHHSPVFYPELSGNPVPPPHQPRFDTSYTPMPIPVDGADEP